MSEFECQAYICPWCFNDHSNLLCKTIDVKERVEKLEQKLAVAQKELEKCGEAITCVKCSEKAECPYAYDGYNTNGDCLAEK